MQSCEHAGPKLAREDGPYLCEVCDLKVSLAKSEALTAEAVARAVEPWREAVKKVLFFDWCGNDDDDAVDAIGGLRAILSQPPTQKEDKK